MLSKLNHIRCEPDVHSGIGDWPSQSIPLRVGAFRGFAFGREYTVKDKDVSSGLSVGSDKSSSLVAVPRR